MNPKEQASTLFHRYAILLFAALGTALLGAVCSAMFLVQEEDWWSWSSMVTHARMAAVGGLIGFLFGLPFHIHKEVNRVIVEIGEKVNGALTESIGRVDQMVGRVSEATNAIARLELPENLGKATLLFREFLPLHGALLNFKRTDLVADLVGLMVQNYCHIPHQTPSDFYRLLSSSLGKAVDTWEGIHHGELLKLLPPPPADAGSNGGAVEAAPQASPSGSEAIAPIDREEARKYFKLLSDISRSRPPRKLESRRIVIVPRDEEALVKDPVFVGRFLQDNAVSSYYIGEETLRDLLRAKNHVLAHRLDDCARYDGRVILHYDRHEGGDRHRGVITIAFDGQLADINRAKTKEILGCVRAVFELFAGQPERFQALDRKYLESLGPAGLRSRA